MRQWFVLIALVVAGLFVAQSTMATTSAYNECCLKGCKGTGHCASPSCLACEAPASTTLRSVLPVPLFDAQVAISRDTSWAASPIKEIWHPPD